jgi:hypothetical protein
MFHGQIKQNCSKSAQIMLVFARWRVQCSEEKDLHLHLRDFFGLTKLKPPPDLLYLPNRLAFSAWRKSSLLYQRVQCSYSGAEISDKTKAKMQTKTLTGQCVVPLRASNTSRFFWSSSSVIQLFGQ